MSLTLAQMRARVQVIYDVTGSAVLSDAEWNQLINDGIRALWSLVTRINKDFRVKKLPFTLDGVTQFVALPSDFREVRAVRLNPGTNSQVYLQKESMRNGSQRYARSYRPEGINLYVEPLQNCAGTYDLVYIPAAPVLVLDADAFDLELEQFQDYPIYRAVVAALQREESDVSQAAALLGAAEEAVTGWASDQRSADPDTVDDVRGQTTWLWGPPG
ncbi:MAG: hypothetical protein JWM82_2510 [Myxococcales bacterium]|nr:hypothetical protein [Myxococcales bacterium]